MRAAFAQTGNSNKSNTSVGSNLLSSDLSLLVIGLILLLLPGNAFGCGAGVGVGSSLNSASAQDFDHLSRTIFDILTWIPSDYSKLLESAVVTFLNDNLAKAFGGSMKVESLQTTGDGKNQISCPSDLNCNFRRPCRWRNVNDEDLSFFNGTGQPNPSRMETLTGSKDLPQEPFALGAGNKGSSAAWLVSDPVPSQPGDGFIEFKYWLTPLVELKVCYRKPNSVQLLFCTPALYSTSRIGPVTVKVPGPINTPFEILFELAHFVVDPGGIGIVDDIAYTSTLCSADANKPPIQSLSASRKQDPKAVIDVPPQQLSSLASSTLPPVAPSSGSLIAADGKAQASRENSQVCKSLSCDFDGGSPCAYNVDSLLGNRPFRLQKGPHGNPLTGIRKDRFGNRAFTGSYLLADGDGASSTEVAAAESPQISLNQPLELSFYRWQGTANSRLRVCLNNLRNCVVSFTEVARDWTESSVRIEPSTSELSDTSNLIKLIFAADGLSANGYLALDDIRVRSSGCGQ